MTEAVTVQTSITDALADSPTRRSRIITVPRPRVERVPVVDAPPVRRRANRSAHLRVASEWAALTAVAVTLVLQVRLPIWVAPLAATSWVLALAAVGHYRRTTLGGTRAAALLRIAKTGAIALLVAVAGTPLSTGAAAPAALSVLVIALVLTHALIVLVAGRPRARIVLAGHPRDIRDALVELRTVNKDDVVAVCLTRRSNLPFLDIPTYYGLTKAVPALVDEGADALVVLPGRHTAPVALRRLQWDVASVGGEIYLGTGLLDVEPQRARVVSTAGLDVLHVAPAALDSPRRIVKDVVERTLALLALMAFLPVLGVLCVMIRRGSPGPAFFRQERVGRNGELFTMIKLRTMGTAAEEERNTLTLSNELDGVMFKIKCDPRVTPLGRQLRRYSLDEVPQLWNVVRGDMSLVGPRPALPGEVENYDVDPRRRLAVKPGLTGLWQVSGRSDLTWTESVRLDLKYVDNWSLSLDASILVRTVRAVLGHRGAY
ncbi:exopolysaccharide biosynthesis polyprenyl glycosylphosphotransferase [Nocardioides sp. BE266]|uniref:exopolysaccharide biosynthesis polyprenyl glycosylphosphotransferase n=1 Tax=Nocardioides sp. BE266 TaxID=2817725 RepID=UPI002856F575|nr:exopolysaccharide biosynthesis polyprenyl glycosylphosphotransferase [Nocardioides sp. BE266]MDR7252436.1 exopolysaccharide biosynthesis polyprenyl glycosylphosphotransferase [Nocardioides sp. BE266]